jgi:hypothetical protein
VCARGRGKKKNDLHKRAAGNTDAIDFREHVAYLFFFVKENKNFNPKHSGGDRKSE